MCKRSVSVFIAVLFLFFAVIGCGSEFSSMMQEIKLRNSKDFSLSDLSEKNFNELDRIHALLKEGSFYIGEVNVHLEELRACGIMLEDRRGFRVEIISSNEFAGLILWEVGAYDIELCITCLESFCGEKIQKKYTVAKKDEELVVKYIFGQAEFERLQKIARSKKDANNIVRESGQGLIAVNTPKVSMPSGFHIRSVGKDKTTSSK
ncbi:MAG: hypothetical protein ABFQ53_03070 [Patescibacteria group bacterium]